MINQYPLVSIIIPVYNAANSIHMSLESIIQQTYQHIEVILVNDCSTDHSLQIINQNIISLENISMKVKVVSHEQNKGVASARNTGLNQATGEYIYFVDADDYIDSDTIEIFVNEAAKNDSDIVGCNWYLTFESNQRKMNQPSFSNPEEAIFKMLHGSMRWNLWLFFVKRSLYELFSIRFIDGANMGEDLMVVVKLFTNAEKVCFVDRAFYHYGQSNEQSLTKIYSDKHIQEVTKNVEEVCSYLVNSEYRDKLGDSLDFLKLNIKLPLLISDKTSQYQKWLEWFSESNEKVMMNKELSIRTRLLQWFAVKKQFWAIQIYYKLVIRFVYGKLYR